MTKENVLKIAETAHLSLTEDEIEIFTQELEKMIDFAKQLEDLDVEGVELDRNDKSLYNVFRKDEVQPSMAKEALLANAPKEKNGCFFVPQVVE